MPRHRKARVAARPTFRRSLSRRIGSPLGRSLVEMTGLNRTRGISRVASRFSRVAPRLLPAVPERSALYGPVRTIATPVFVPVGGRRMSRLAAPARRRRRRRLVGLGAPRRRRRARRMRLLGEPRRRRAARRGGRRMRGVSGLNAGTIRSLVGLGMNIGEPRRRRRYGRRRMRGLGQLAARRRYGRRGRRMRGLGYARLRGLSTSALGQPFIGSFKFLFSPEGLEAIAANVGGRVIGKAITGLGQGYIFTSAGVVPPGSPEGTKAPASKDFLSNVLGDLAGAAVAWELGKMVSPTAAMYAAIGAVSRFLGGFAENKIADDIILTNILGDQKGRVLGDINSYGYFGQVRTPDTEELMGFDQIRTPDTEEFMGLEQEDNTLFG